MSAAALRARAKARGILTSHRDMHGNLVRASDEGLRAVLAALDAGARGRELPEVIVAWNGLVTLPRGIHATAVAEDGTERECRAGTRLPLGYFELTRGREKTLVIAAPKRAFTGERGRSSGVFAPLYALRRRKNLGVGDLGDLRELRAWMQARGGSVVGTLPLLASFNDPASGEPFDPSPYAPASRLFWNELYLEIEPGARHAREIEALRRTRHVDWARVARLKLAILHEHAQRFFRGPRDARYEQFRRERPELVAYARFRARGDRAREQRHLYAQFLCEQQLRSLGDGLYLDLPIGAHRESFDLHAYRDDFALDASVGAPPDPFFTGGQDWGFPPMHPSRARANGYRYLRACLAHSMRHASFLRIDHVMGLHRLFWIPKGGDASLGAYVSYPHEELYALLTLESHRAQCVVAGEDLGLVPKAVRAAMRRHAIRRLYVLPWEMQKGRPRPVPRDCVASLNTHDMPPFAAEHDPRQLRRWLRFLAESDAQLALVSLEDLLGETRPQNVPGTVSERNWSRKVRTAIERVRADAKLLWR